MNSRFAAAPSLHSHATAAKGAQTKSWGFRVVSGALICLTGGVALSALNDLAIYHGCSSKAMEKASKNQAIIDAIEDSWFSFLRPHDWEILIMEALLHVPGNEELQQTFRISVSDYPSPSVCKLSTDCGCPQSESLEKK
ncbi:Hypothetical predicted protein [Olea europaea subsp. europaea]|uniref:Uncharacterized protein n=1 Tax=Olea europaea subsp. europaea TaxID=158383 RepID=A0A8S0SS29_OLEEU|nr:Hypothetical predicted protein [Olea europaea subsp. europaea]